MLAVVLVVAARGAESFAPALAPAVPNAALQIRMNGAGAALPAPEPQTPKALLKRAGEAAEQALLKLGKATEGESTLVVELPQQSQSGEDQSGFDDLAELMKVFSSVALPAAVLAAGSLVAGAATVAWRRATAPISPAEVELAPAVFLVAEEAPPATSS